MSKDLEQLRAENARLREAQDALINIVEGIGVMSHGTWRNDHGKRLKDTREWVRFYNTRDALSADPAPVGDEWQPIETAPHETPVLLYCPDRGCPSNRERIELGCYSTGERVGHTSTMSYHSWATHWMPLPPPPSGENGND